MFEVDLILTSDGKLAARHDWLPYTADLLQQKWPEDRLGDMLNLREFKGTQILEKYKPLSFRDIVKLMQQYPDVYIVTDTKETDIELVRKQFQYMKQVADELDSSVLNRLIPEFYTPAMFEAVMNIYPFPNKLYSLYLSDEPQEQTVRFVKENGIQTVAMPVERAEAIPDFIADLNRIGVKTYVHAVNKPEEVTRLSRLGIYGVYTDFLPNRSRFFTESEGIVMQRNVEGTASAAVPFGNTISTVYVFVFMTLLLIIFAYRDRIGRTF